MVLNDEIHIAELVYAGENVSITETGASFINEKQKVEISLKKALEVNDLFGIGTNDEMKISASVCLPQRSLYLKAVPLSPLMV